MCSVSVGVSRKKMEVKINSNISVSHIIYSSIKAKKINKISEYKKERRQKIINENDDVNTY